MSNTNIELIFKYVGSPALTLFFAYLFIRWIVELYAAQGEQLDERTDALIEVLKEQSAAHSAMLQKATDQISQSNIALQQNTRVLKEIAMITSRSQAESTRKPIFSDSASL